MSIHIYGGGCLLRNRNCFASTRVDPGFFWLDLCCSSLKFSVLYASFVYLVTLLDVSLDCWPILNSVLSNVCLIIIDIPK
jgi:hypothetical protein